MASAPENYFVVLLAGGTGTRLWPGSRKSTPKQFAKFFSPQTLFRQTLERVRELIPWQRIFIITNRDQVAKVKGEAPELPQENIIAEPEKKNTALAMGVAAAYVYRRNPQAVIINLATDHLIGDLKIYQQTLLNTAAFTQKHQALATIGIVPATPHTGYEYIKLGKVADTVNSQPIHHIDGFIKRPEFTDPDNPIPRAQEYLKSGQYLWNANNFVWPAKVILEEFRHLAPDLYQNIHTIYQALGTPQEENVLAQEYHRAREDQIEFAIAEKTDKIYVSRGEFAWNDIGNWKIVYDLAPKDDEGNATITTKAGKYLGIDTKNSLIQTESRLVTTLGVENLIVVDTKDALLICHVDRAQDVRDLVKKLKKNNLNEYL